MININFNGIKNSFGSNRLINLNFDLKKRNLPKFNETEKEFDYGKHHMISNYHNFSILPHFEILESTMNKLLVERFYNVAIKLTKDFEFSDSQFEYFKNTFLAKNVKNKLDLIEYLTTEREQKNRNDSRYYLGFRSVYFVLNNNLENVNYEYLAEINKILEPFFSSYKHTELLTFGLSYKEK